MTVEQCSIGSYGCSRMHRLMGDMDRESYCLLNGQQVD